MTETELTAEEEHRNAIRLRLAEVSAANRERRRMEVIFMRVARVHAETLARNLASRMRAPLPAYRMRRWLWNLKRLVMAPFFRRRVW